MIPGAQMGPNGVPLGLPPGVGMNIPPGIHPSFMQQQFLAYQGGQNMHPPLPMAAYVPQP